MSHFYTNESLLYKKKRAEMWKKEEKEIIIGKRVLTHKMSSDFHFLFSHVSSFLNQKLFDQQSNISNYKTRKQVASSGQGFIW